MAAAATVTDLTLERFSKRIGEAYQRTQQGRALWIEGTIELALVLREAREQMGIDDRAFGLWLEENGHVISRHDRTALINMSVDVVKLREVLETTHRKSWQTIWANEMKGGIYPNVRLDQSKKRRPIGPKTIQAREVVRPLVEAGETVNRVKLDRETGLGSHAFQAALAYERGRLEGKQEVQAVLSGSAEEKLEHFKQRFRAQLEAQFADRLSLEIERHTEEFLMPFYKDKLARAEVLLKGGKPFTNREFLSLLQAVHPDSTNGDNRNDAFILLKAREVELRPLETRERPFTSTLPTTLAELLARRKAKKTR